MANTRRLMKKRDQAASRQGGVCYYCYSCLTLYKKTADHKVPRSVGGGSDTKNLVAACFACNHAKGTMSEEEFLQSDRYFNILQSRGLVRRVHVMSDAIAVVRQPDGITCGPSCLLSVLLELGRPLPNTRETVKAIGQMIGTNPETGTTDALMSDGLKMFGVRFSRKLENRRSVAALRNVILAGYLVILRTMSLGKHWVVAYGVESGSIKIMCPTRGLITWTDEECDRHWGARDYHSFMVKAR